MRQRSRLRRPLVGLVFACGVLGGAAPGRAAVAMGGPLAVRILFDNSGSMYPGYRPKGTPGRQTKKELGVPYFYQDAEFQQWLADFVAAQTIFDAGTVGMWTFTSTGAFHPGDIHNVHAEVPVPQFDVEQAVKRFPYPPGESTPLQESLSEFARGFEGLVWLITDNIVESGDRTPDVDVGRFFVSLHDDPRFVSVHLFKYPIERRGHRSALAIYGILVSPHAVPREVLAYYDRKMRSSFRFANCRRGDPPAPLFPGREHLKLRDLSVDALELQTAHTLEVALDDPSRDILDEGQRVQIAIQGTIQSHLTQHSVIHGRYRIDVLDLEPDEEAERGFGAKRIAGDTFAGLGGSIEEPIPPNGTREVTGVLHSAAPVTLAGGGLGAWLHLAIRPVEVHYRGILHMRFDDVQVRVEPEPMAGIFGVEQAPGIFRFQAVSDLQVAPSDAEVHFRLRSGGSRATILLLVLAVLAALLLGAAALLGRRAWYIVRISGIPDRLVGLRRLGGFQVVHEGQPLGRLGRGASGQHHFSPSAGSVAVAVLPTRQADTWDVRFRDGRSYQLSIVARSGDRGRTPPPSLPAAPTGGLPLRDPGPGLRAGPGSGSNSGASNARPGAAPARPLPKIGRP